jgi:endonuclease G
VFKRIFKVILVIIVFQSLAFCQEGAKINDEKKDLLYENGTLLNADSIPLYIIKDSRILKLELPKTDSKDKIITHTGYSFLYNEIHEQADWVAYELTKEETNKIYERTNKFILDPKVTTFTASDSDYKGSGYDRGHLAPASDMGWSSIAMKESFYYSNMSPQKPSFNRGIWKKLEELVRTWAVENNNLYIVTGPVLKKELESIGVNKVSVPKYYYKVILDFREPSIKGIGFILPNRGSKEPLNDYAVTIDSVEKFTGIDFFPSLQDKQENLIESTLCIECWSWKNSKSTNKISNNKTALSTQCTGTTKKGKRCKRMTKNENGRCFQH